LFIHKINRIIHNENIEHEVDMLKMGHATKRKMQCYNRYIHSSSAFMSSQITL